MHMHHYESQSPLNILYTYLHLYFLINIELKYLSSLPAHNVGHLICFYFLPLSISHVLLKLLEFMCIVTIPLLF